ncbi:MAG TPA: TadG family pilus assembly protein [Tepidisphaeraceae bacterium]|nr:TadG family pilus assembly protein [Tepidisphaeraceae bacterium]
MVRSIGRISTRTARRARFQRAGLSVVYLCVALALLMAFASLAVDWGRVQLTRTELRRAADAAARYAVAGLSSDLATAQENARSVAASNTADGTPVILDINQDIEFGTWNPNTRTFTVLSGSARAGANAVRVTARRTTQRGNPVPLLFARIIGRDHCDLTASAIAMKKTGYTLVGIDSVSLSGVARIDSYNSADGSYDPSRAGSKTVVVSNGNITVGSACTIYGEAHPGPGASLIGAASVTGSTSPLPAPLNFPMPSVDPSYNNAAIASYLTASNDLDLSGKKTYTLNSGVYFVRNVSLAGTANLRVRGQVTLYVYGNLLLNGTVDVQSERPGDFKIRMTSPGTSVSIGGNSALYADLYAPASTVTLSGTGDFYGTVVGKTLSVIGRAGIHYDESTMPYGGGGTGIALVE